MAETLTYDPGTDTVTMGDGETLTPAEQESLEVGEALEQSQDQLLAGKYKDAQELEKAYVELQKKLGGEDNKDSGEPRESEETPEVESREDTKEKEEAPEGSEAATLIAEASEEYYNSEGKLSEDTISKFQEMSSTDLVNAYMEIQSKLPQNTPEVPDLSDQVINQVKNYAGGEKAYSDLVNWAGNNLDQQSIDAFDSIVNTGSVEAIKLAVSGLKSQYQDANGYEGKMVTGKAPKEAADVYQSQQELVQAMSDRRYDNDPAYRIQVLEKLERSGDLQF